MSELATELQARVSRWTAFYAGAPAVPFVFTIAHDPEAPPRPLPNPALRAERLEWAWGLYERRLARTAWLHDDSLPCLEVYTGTEIFAEAFGCPVHRPEDNMPFALPRIVSAAEVDDLPEPAVFDSPLAALFEMADALRARAGGDALLRMVDLQSPMDVAALIWDKNDFYSAMIETPEAVLALTEKVARLQTAFLDQWFARYGRAHIAHFPFYYMPDGVTMSVDEVGVVNGAMFDAYFAPELAALSARYGAIGIHCCANSRHQWPRFAAVPGLRVLNLCQPEEVVREAYRYFAPVCAQYHWSVWQGPAWTWPAQWPAGARVIIEVGAETREEAQELAERLGAVRKQLGGVSA
jgi:hypothetical protein